MSAPKLLYVAVYDPMAVASGIEELEELYRHVVVSMSGEVDSNALIQHIGMLRGMTLFHEAFKGANELDAKIEVSLSSSTIIDLDAGEHHVIVEVSLTDSFAVQQATVIIKRAITNYTLLCGEKQQNDTLKLYWDSFLALFNTGGVTDVLPWCNRLNPSGALSMIPSRDVYRRSALGGIDFNGVECSAAIVFYTGKTTVKNYGARYLRTHGIGMPDKSSVIWLYNMLEFLDYNGNLSAIQEGLTVDRFYSVPSGDTAAGSDAGAASTDNSSSAMYGFLNPLNFDPREYYPDPRQLSAQALNPLTITNKFVVLPFSSTMSTIGSWINGEPTNAENHEQVNGQEGNENDDENSTGSFLIGLMKDDSSSITKRTIHVPCNGTFKPFQLVLYLSDDHLFAVLFEPGTPGLSNPSFYEDLASQFDSSLGMSKSVMTFNSIQDLVADPNILYVICNIHEGSIRTSLPFLGPPAITYLHEQLIELGTESSSPSDTEFLHKFRSNRSNDWTIYRITYNDSVIFILLNHHRGTVVSGSGGNRPVTGRQLTPTTTLDEGGIGLFEALGDDVKQWLSSLQNDDV
ncbi:uncharacterized protein KQ657_001806 [Scheffersomyces spartinae]|uniref:CCZ1/INTU/HSP4 first Longin domain-containing protein n=1 Tax=Scheffersomyces spartinae TaxID=45513 RepID=A0A9P7V745_9ASCO|nr:uncharacterized protein KQ657_001806 [Scheffersomyces spartinae]KAG7192407.1 hypothetical protein KQ657_001806 [Scheffersomyces spartinae]